MHSVGDLFPYKATQGGGRKVILRSEVERKRNRTFGGRLKFIFIHARTNMECLSTFQSDRTKGTEGIYTSHIAMGAQTSSPHSWLPASSPILEKAIRMMQNAVKAKSGRIQQTRKTLLDHRDVGKKREP